MAGSSMIEPPTFTTTVRVTGLCGSSKHTSVVVRRAKGRHRPVVETAVSVPSRELRGGSSRALSAPQCRERASARARSRRSESIATLSESAGGDAEPFGNHRTRAPCCSEELQARAGIGRFCAPAPSFLLRLCVFLHDAPSRVPGCSGELRHASALEALRERQPAVRRDDVVHRSPVGESSPARRCRLMLHT